MSTRKYHRKGYKTKSKTKDEDMKESLEQEESDPFTVFVSSFLIFY